MSTTDLYSLANNARGANEERFTSTEANGIKILAARAWSLNIDALTRPVACAARGRMRRYLNMALHKYENRCVPR